MFNGEKRRTSRKQCLCRPLSLLCSFTYTHTHLVTVRDLRTQARQEHGPEMQQTSTRMARGLQSRAAVKERLAVLCLSIQARVLVARFTLTPHKY